MHTVKEEERLIEDGNARRSRRVKMSEVSLEKIPPNDDERYIIHNMFVEGMQAHTALAFYRYEFFFLLSSAVW